MEPEIEKENLVKLLSFRVRYSKTDRMGAICNSRVLEWFEMGEVSFFGKWPYDNIRRGDWQSPWVRTRVEIYVQVERRWPLRFLWANGGYDNIRRGDWQSPW